MLVLFVGWGAFFVYRTRQVPQRRQPQGQTTTEPRARSRRASKSAIVVIEMVLLVFYAIPAWAKRVRGFPAENEATVVRVVGEQFAWNIQYPGPDGIFGRTDITLCRPPTIRSAWIAAIRRRKTTSPHQSAEPAGRQAGARASVEQGRHPQLRSVRDARETGRRPGPGHPGLVHSEHSWATTKSPARSSAASVTTGCAVSSA